MSNTNPAGGGFGANAQALCRRTWWVFLAGGLASLIFGALAVVRPGLALYLLAMFFAASVLVDGAFNFLGSLGHRDKDGWWVMLLIGVLGLLVGGYALVNPAMGMVAFLYVVAFQAIMLGAFLVMLGYKVRKATTREWVLYVTGALSVVFGVVVITNPLAGAVPVVYMVASWALIVGALKVWFSFKVRAAAGRQGDRFSALH